MTITQDKKDVDINGYITYYDVPMTKVGDRVLGRISIPTDKSAMRASSRTTDARASSSTMTNKAV